MTAAQQLSDDACPRCLPLAGFGRIRAETVQRLPASSAPLSMDDNKPCCHDCASADTLVKMGVILNRNDNSSTHFVMARVAVGNDRQEQYRLPGVPLGLVAQGFMRASEPGDLEAQWDWLDANDWFGLRSPDEGWA